jgi:hypothetical protein
MPPFRYRLIDRDGADLGPLVSGYAALEVGGLIPRALGVLRITAVVEPETEETFNAYLVVEPFDARP